MGERVPGKDESAEKSQAAKAMAAAETGLRSPLGPVGKLLAGVALAWSLFQLWIASPLPFLFADVLPVLNDTKTRSIHLAFAVFLVYTGRPALKRSPQDRVPRQDWVFALLGAFCAAYLFLFYEALAERQGLPTTTDLVVAGTGLVLLLEATRRALGPPLTIVALVFLAYIFFGDRSFVPEAIQWKGASFAKAMSHQWLGTEGVFGIAIGVSSSMVFLFVLFGALLEKAGAGNYFIRVAFALLGHMRGGPAKAAVVSSGMTGIISGSSIANVVTTGTFTIPLMKRVGFSAEKAGAVEVASSTNGQLMPPIMGAAAFLMVEFVGISYVEVIKHAFLPAVISYIALVYIVHLEAVKAGMKGLPRRTETPFIRAMIGFLTGVIGLVILSGVVYYGLGWIKGVAGAATPYVAVLLLCLAYLALLKYATRHPELEVMERIDVLPEPGPTIKAGLYYLLPLVVLIWCLTVERFSPGLSAFWAATFMCAIVVTQHALKSILRREAGLGGGLRRGLVELRDGLIAGARNMVGIGVATATAGIIVGTVTLTGIGLVMTEFVELVSGGNLMFMLLMTAVISLILGMGLPTTANYIVVSSLMAPVIVTLGAQNGLIVPLIAVHMFVFYFGILADDTPPVGLGAFAAAAISKGDPIRTGIQGFTYDIRTAILPFMFIFNTELLMIDIQGPLHLVLTIATALCAMLAFASATQGYLIVKNRLWEIAALLLIAFTLFRPGFWLDMVQPPFRADDPARLIEIAGGAAPNSDIRLKVEGENFATGEMVAKTVLLPLGPAGEGAARLQASAGITMREEDGKTFIDAIEFGSPAEKAKLDFDWEITEVIVPADRLPKQILYIPALALLLFIYLQQRRRRAGPVAAAAPAAD
ncbi:MAG: TRAP transporter permease [Kiloniellales bacterium]|nr:TRAP transporter permease [Kiloniellales bacterium]